MSIPLGSTIAQYEIREPLGSGGMGDVYRARDRRLGRDVAIKLLPARFASDRNRLARFEQEARAASALNHPNIVTIHEIGEWQGLPYIVMELVLGRTLRELVGGRPFLTRRAIDVAAQTAEGLAAAHTAGIVHRDLKPENVMVRDDGFVKILDFGLAKLTTPSFASPDGESEGRTPAPEDAPTQEELGLGSPDTGAGAVIGTAGYMSPEQALGRPVDFRADQFALGAILYEMATGKRAFQRESPVQTLAAVIEQEPVPIQELRPSVPAAFRWIVERCLAKDPGSRYASTHDLALDLRGVRDHFEEASGGSGSGAGARPAPRPARLDRRRLALRAVPIALLLAVVAWKWCPPKLEQRLAVLPFSSAAEDSESRAFTEGLVETLTSKLTQLERFQGSLWVVPASEVRAAAVTSAAAARRSFGVSLVVTGSVQRAGGQVRLTANLVDAESLRQLRAVTVDARLEDLAVLQDGLVARVAAMLELEIPPEARQVLASGGTSVASAWESYVKGRGYLARYEDPANIDKAIAAFQQALQRDPEYALAYAGLGEAHWRRYELTKEPQSVELARKACERALSLNDLLAPVHVTQGLVQLGSNQPAAAQASFERALALDPVSADALSGLARAQELQGRLQQAEATYQRAIELRPEYWGGHNQLGGFYAAQGRFEDAARAFDRVIELTPDNPRGYSNRGGIAFHLGDDAAAERLFQRSAELRPTATALSNLATVQFYRGEYVAAAASFAEAVKLREADYRLWINLAASRYFAPGQREGAADAYREAVRLALAELEIRPGDVELLVDLADCYSLLGERERARALLDSALHTTPADPGVLAKIANVYEQIGERDDALAWLQRARANGHPLREIERNPFLGELRKDLRFKHMGQPDVASKTAR